MPNLIKFGGIAQRNQKQEKLKYFSSAAQFPLMRALSAAIDGLHEINACLCSVTGCSLLVNMGYLMLTHPDWSNLELISHNEYSRIHNICTACVGLFGTNQLAIYAIDELDVLAVQAK